MKRKVDFKPTKSLKSEKRGVDVLKSFTFPEHGVSIQAIDIKDAKNKLAERLEGVKKL